MLSYKQFLKNIREDEEKPSEHHFSKHSGTQPWADDPELKPLMGIRHPNMDDSGFLMGRLFKRYINPIFRKFERAVKRCATNDAQVIVDVKGCDCIFNSIRHGIRLPYMKDLLRAVILVDYEEDIDYVLDNIEDEFDVYLAKDNEYGYDKEWGYAKDAHYLVDFEGVMCEIQVMLKDEWHFKNRGHMFFDIWTDLLMTSPIFMGRPLPDHPHHPHHDEPDDKPKPEHPEPDVDEPEDEPDEPVTGLGRSVARLGGMNVAEPSVADTGMSAPAGPVGGDVAPAAPMGGGDAPVGEDDEDEDEKKK